MKVFLFVSFIFFRHISRRRQLLPGIGWGSLLLGCCPFAWWLWLGWRFRGGCSCLYRLMGQSASCEWRTGSASTCLCFSAWSGGTAVSRWRSFLRCLSPLSRWPRFFLLFWGWPRTSPRAYRARREYNALFCVSKCSGFTEWCRYLHEACGLDVPSPCPWWLPRSWLTCLPQAGVVGFWCLLHLAAMTPSTDTTKKHSDRHTHAKVDGQTS